MLKKLSGRRPILLQGLCSDQECRPRSFHSSYLLSESVVHTGASDNDICVILRRTPVIFLL